MIEDLPSARFPVILADPPWPHATWSNKGKGRSAEAHYDTMSLAEICNLPIGTLATPDCVLFLWVTKPILERAFDVIRAWRFTCKTVGFTWIKTRTAASRDLFTPLDDLFWFGMGHWTRGNPEMCLLATRGNPKRLHADVAELIIAPRREHSRKPDEIYQRIERLVAGPYLELFASGSAPPRNSWTRWVGKDRAAVRRWKSHSYPGEVAP